MDKELAGRLQRAKNGDVLAVTAIEYDMYIKDKSVNEFYTKEVLDAFNEKGVPKALDVQVGGDHYKDQGIQPWEVIEANNLDFWEGNAIKYIMRYKNKNGVEDLKKAKHYIDYLIERGLND